MTKCSERGSGLLEVLDPFSSVEHFLNCPENAYVVFASRCKITLFEFQVGWLSASSELDDAIYLHSVNSSEPCLGPLVLSVMQI